MEKQMIISIGREYGSGGHEIAAKLAEYFDIPLLDRKMLDDVAAEKGVSPEVLEKYDEKPRVFGISRTVRGYSNSNAQNLLEMQFEYIKKKAEAGESFVVVGRCSELLLKGNPNLVSFFILGDKQHKIERVMHIYHLSEKEALQKMQKHDKSRKEMHNQYSHYHWGDSRNYDICINSSSLGMDETVRFLAHFARSKFDLGHPIEY